MKRTIVRIRRNTALDLTLRFALVFLLCAAVLFVTVDYLLARAQLERDQQLVGSWLESYQRLEQQAGLHKLELVIDRDAPYLQRSGMRVEVQDATGQTLMLVQPQGWGERTARRKGARPSLDPPWHQVSVDLGHPSGQAQRLLMREVALQGGVRLRIGISVTPREAQLASYRLLMLQVMLPLILLGLLLTAYMNWRALRPVHDLIRTVRSLRARELDARVQIRNPRSELGELAQLFNEMLAQIESLIQGMQQSLDSVAHDLRTPLARMRLSLENALSKPDEHRLKEALLDCAEESERIERMLRMLMDLSEAESGALRLQHEAVDLNDLVDESVELYRYVADEKQIELCWHPEAPCRLEADVPRLRQVLGNLIDNAIKYTPPGGQVTIGCASQGPVTQLWVEDTGIGIDEPDQGHIFERLYRADQSRHEPGMGLGLSLVRAVVEAFGGHISLQSTPGQGSRFRVELPTRR